VSEPVERAGFAAEPRGDENAAGIDPGVARLAGMLRSIDPALRLAGVEEFAALAERGPVDSALLVASIEAAAAGPPRRNLGGVYAGALQRAWVAVARQTPAVAAMWYRKVLDTVAGFDLADPGQARLAVELVRWAGGRGTPSPTSPYAPMLREHVERLHEVLLELAAAPERELYPAEPDERAGANTLAALIQNVAAFAVAHTSFMGDDDIRAGVAVRVPELLAGHPVTGLRTYVRLLRDHPQPEQALAEVIDTVVRECPPGVGSARRHIGEVLLEEDDFDLPALAEHLRSYATGWPDEGLDALVREAPLDGGGDDLVRRLRRSAARRAVPAMLVGLGRTSPTMRELADIVAAAESGPPPAAPPAGGGVPFTDINLKLVVIEELMYSQSVLTPAFDMWEFAKAHEGREINIEREGYDVIPEALEYFTNLPLTPEALAQVTKLDFDGGLEVYGQVLPFWGGEDDTFDVHSFADVVHLPNLRRVALNGFAADDADLSPLHQRGIVVTD